LGGKRAGEASEFRFASRLREGRPGFLAFWVLRRGGNRAVSAEHLANIMTTEESFVDFSCPHCGEAASFPQEDAGAVRECPVCMESLIVPEAGGGQGRKIPLPIQTPRLKLRRLAPGDWRDLLEFMADEELFEFLEDVPLDEDRILQWLEADRFVKFTTPDHPVYLGLEQVAGGKVIGFIRLHFTDAHRLQTALRVFLSRKFQRQGFGKEAVRAVLKFCFQDLKLHRVTAACDSRHDAARRLCESAGLRREGEFLKDRLVRGEWASTVCYAALGDEYVGTDG
jgi:RimJ/RimL family protein N-acetyltransferase